jgi:hypothetical protein
LDNILVPWKKVAEKKGKEARTMITNVKAHKLAVSLVQSDILKSTNYFVQSHNSLAAQNGHLMACCASGIQSSCLKPHIFLLSDFWELNISSLYF